ncbi:DUF5994 family protein [Microtetraspora sp. NBRC 13810]|uniref:DUF5994 family protein n=1 Tax=Microtetraspora sp. NBRC 13810 TaxID=3030990 RepID=UPI002552A401|nr:DUF5994 family protein [Microtetraspora sp. NBRC 13810]
MRFVLFPGPSRPDVPDGAWWPYSRDAAAELPGLISMIDEWLGGITLRVSLHLDAWDDLPRHISARGRRIQVDWFRDLDPRLIKLTLAGAEDVILLVVIPGVTDLRPANTPRPYGMTEPLVGAS